MLQSPRQCKVDGVRETMQAGSNQSRSFPSQVCYDFSLMVNSDFLLWSNAIPSGVLSCVRLCLNTVSSSQERSRTTHTRVRRALAREGGRQVGHILTVYGLKITAAVNICWMKLWSIGR